MSVSFFNSVIFNIIISLEFAFSFGVFNLNVRKSMVYVYKSLHFSLKLSHFIKSRKHLERDYAWQENKQDFTRCSQ